MLRRWLFKRSNWGKLSAPLRTLTNRWMKLCLEGKPSRENIAINSAENLMKGYWWLCYLLFGLNSFTLSSPRSYPEKQCQSLCWNSTSPVTSRLPWTNSILIGEIILSPQLCLHHHRHSGRMAKMDWSFTLMQITSSTCGAQKCCSPLRRPAPREEGWGKSERGLSLLTNCSSITCHRVIFMLENWSLWM